MKPEFLTTPARWTTAPRVDQTPRAYAASIERYRRQYTVADKAVWLALALAAIAFVVMALGGWLPGGGA